MSKDFKMVLLIVFLILGSLINRHTMNRKITFEDVYVKGKDVHYTILIEVDNKKLKLINRENESILKTYTIATGKPNSPTPLGTFKIVEKAKWG